MSINLAALPSPVLPSNLGSIELGIDPLPYAQLRATGRYPAMGMPDDIPPVYAILSSLTKQQVPDMLSTDGERNLNVNIAAGASGGGVSPVKMQYAAGQLGYIASGQVITAAIGVITAIYALTVSWAPDSSTPGQGDRQECSVSVTDAALSHAMVLAEGTGSWLVTANYATPPETFGVYFPVPVDITNQIPAGSSCKLVINVPKSTAAGYMILYT